MKSDRLQDALGMVRDDYVLDAHSEKKTRTWRRWGTLAACLCLAAVCVIGVPKLLNRENPKPGLKEDSPAPGDVQEPVPYPGPEGPAPWPGGVAGPNWPFNEPDPVEPHGDWPVIYNQVDAMPDGTHYFSLAGRPLTDTECPAVIPEILASWLTLESATANFCGAFDENGRLQEDARLDSVELRFTDPDRGCAAHVGFWPADRTSIFAWAAQFNPGGTQETNFGSDHDTRFLTLYECEDTVWTYFTCGDVSYCVSAEKEFRDGVEDNFYRLVLALLHSEKTPDFSFLVPNP